MKAAVRCPFRYALLLPVLAASVLLPASVLSDGPYRTFTDTQARSFEGVLQAFDAIKDIVTIERADGKAGNVPLAVFSEEDRRYIRMWGMTNDFMRHLRIDARLHDADLSGEELEGAAYRRPTKKYYYSVQLENNSTSAFERIRVEYCIFYRQGERDGPLIRYDEGTLYGKTEFKPLHAGAVQQFRTGSVMLYSEAGVQTMFGRMDHLSTADIRGIWLRMKMTPPAGPEMVREHRTSDDKNWIWTPYSIGAGLNEGSGRIRHILN